MPEGHGGVEIGATVGIVIGRETSNVNEAGALSHIAGYVIVNDVSLTHSSYYRPSIRLKARDGYCPIGPVVVPTQDAGNPGRVECEGLDRRRRGSGDEHPAAERAPPPVCWPTSASS